MASAYLGRRLLTAVVTIAMIVLLNFVPVGYFLTKSHNF